MIFFSRKNRPFELGPYPLERLKHDEKNLVAEKNRSQLSAPGNKTKYVENSLSSALNKYHSMFRDLNIIEPLPGKAPVPDDLARRSKDIKGAAYFLDAAQVGICQMMDNAWYKDKKLPDHDYAIAIIVRPGRTPEKDNIAHDWVSGNEILAANLRAFEIAIAVSQHIQGMGFIAKAHDKEVSDVDIDRITIMAGLTVRKNDKIVNPYLDKHYGVAVVTTEYSLSCDLPLASTSSNGRGIGYWLGLGSSLPGIEWGRREKR